MTFKASILGTGRAIPTKLINNEFVEKKKLKKRIVGFTKKLG